MAERFASRESSQTAQADTYRRQIDTAQAAVKSQLAARNFQVVGSVSEILNAIFVTADASRVAELQSIPGVAAVRPAKRLKMLLNRATALSNAPAAWTAVGGQSKAGAGIKIGILDTGIDQTHPALQDSSLSTPSGFPKGDSNYTTNKVIVARSYVNLLAAGSSSNPAADSMPDDLTARDRSGHGTFNAVIAAGNTVTTPALASAGGNVTISGMAPKAWLGSYKVQGTDGVNGFSDDQVLISAVNDAVKDGMDIINCSFGGLAASDAASDPLAAAFQNATKSAVVVVSAGDDGATSYNGGYSYPGFNTIASPSNAPDVISVGATINSHVMLPTVSINASSAPSNLKNISAAVGDSFFFPSQVGSNVAPLVDITALGNDGTACSALPANSLNGAFALILRGTCTFDTKAANAQNAGAIGFIYYMADSSAPVSPEGINEFGPAVMVSNSDGLNLKKYADANPGATVLVDLNGLEQDLTTYNSQPCLDPTTGPCPAFSPAVAANQFASYSSMGPTPDGQLKPDMVAPGGFDPEQVPDPNGDLFAAAGFFSASQNFDPGGVMFSSNRYAAAAGTSFSSPLAAGAAALMKQLHPTLTPVQIKSLLVNYAAQDTTTDDFADPVDVEMIGGGRLDAGAASNGSVTAVPSTVSFGILNSATLPITKQITLTNISSGSITLNAAVNCCTVNQSAGSSGNAKVAVSPTSVPLAAGATATLTVTLSGSAPTAGEYSGNITLSNSSTTMRIPFMMLEGNGTVANVLPLGGGEGAPSEDIGSAAVQVTDAFGVPVANSSVTFSVSPKGTMTLNSVTGEPACTPASSTTSITCPSDQFGYAYVETVLGSSVSSPTLNFSAAGNTGSFSYNIQAPPAITAASVVDAAIFKQPIAPGSYINIYGTGLSNPTFSPNGDSNDATTDALAANGTYSILPLQIDFVTVSFDIPSAGISVPGHLTFVSPGVIQLQVPWELQGQSSAQVKVVLDNDLFGNVVTVPLQDTAPQFFTNGTNVADALDTSYKLISTSNPAKRGSTIFLYANALGPVNNQPTDGAPALDATSTTKNPVTVTIGGQTATASFAGLAPGFPGLYQINVAVPQGSATGNAVPITITVNGQTSAQSTIPVQ
ncbi:MAG TPA: S8 family serine peptidase [Bryobacteraceae bacterium]|nr:S8 family serine peptidase [Bryobacteraceae bacterium]